MLCISRRSRAALYVLRIEPFQVSTLWVPSLMPARQGRGALRLLIRAGDAVLEL